MKKLIFLLSLFLSLSIAGYSQFYFGTGLTYDIGENIGVRGTVIYDVDDTWTGQASFSYFFDNDFTIWAIDFDAHYQLIEISNSDDFAINPFAGLNVSRIGDQVGNIRVSDTDLGINLGINIKTVISELSFFIEPKFVIGGLGGFVVSAGIVF